MQKITNQLKLEILNKIYKRTMQNYEMLIKKDEVNAMEKLLEEAENS